LYGARLTNLAIFFTGIGEGAEPALQALASSFVEPCDYAKLFTSMVVVEAIGRLLGNPLMAGIHRSNRDEQGQLTGLVFFTSTVNAYLF
jgi:hypothetical protein